MRLVLTSCQSKQAGLTSIMVVIFASLLLSVITISFAYLMNNELQRSSDDDLSQSAYDSAMAGVEDAKRVVMLAKSGGVAGAKAQAAISAGGCKTVAEAGVAGDPLKDETVIQSSEIGSTGAAMNQAYTCVTIDMNSPEYITELQEMSSVMIPLRGVADIASVRVQWHSTASGADYGDSCGIDTVLYIGLCQHNNWGNEAEVPALMRAQTITPGSNFEQSDLDSDEAGATVFLYPKTAASAEHELSVLERYVNNTSVSGGASNSVSRALCDTGLIVPYRCQAELVLDDAIEAYSNTALLRLTAIYSGTEVRITLLDSSGREIDFDGVQPVVDSTGRANDLFRRVEARLSLTSDQVYPEFAVDIGGSLCKDFYVTSSNSGGSSCSP